MERYHHDSIVLVKLVPAGTTDATTGMTHTIGSPAKRQVAGNSGKSVKPETMGFPANMPFAQNARTILLVGPMALRR